jgi:hypothetical protein
MLPHRVGNPRRRIRSCPCQTATLIPGSRIRSNFRIDLAQARDRAGHEDSTPPEGTAPAVEIPYRVLSRDHRESVAAGISRAEFILQSGQSADLGGASFETGIQIFRVRQAALSR